MQGAVATRLSGKGDHLPPDPLHFVVAVLRVIFYCVLDAPSPGGPEGVSGLRILGGNRVFGPSPARIWGYYNLNLRFGP